MEEDDKQQEHTADQEEGRMTSYVELSGWLNPFCDTISQV